VLCERTLHLASCYRSLARRLQLGLRPCRHEDLDSGLKHHVPTVDEEIFAVKEGTTFRFDVERFELTGYAVLDVTFGWVLDGIEAK